ncbi:uncharacterized protein DUF3107 [Motilibacter peucedani]|uniref:Uncharacterized protein DUF3107 n=1 Tax=Motilibacter peucedani TaxID=598650 RepID=A0A420XMK3_9ACTN|nr:DUF3107 domain-containing protein [Motilibacter peucedani]RKS72505.1 uncharacterized protein DUF3107 [Motilibacter peucedani]
MEVKIGVQQAARELVVESAQTADEVSAAVAAAIAAGGVLTLSDDKGRQVIVAVDKLAYVEIGVPEVRRVGFGAIVS